MDGAFTVAAGRLKRLASTAPQERGGAPAAGDLDPHRPAGAVERGGTVAAPERAASRRRATALTCVKADGLQRQDLRHVGWIWRGEHPGQGIVYRPAAAAFHRRGTGRPPRQVPGELKAGARRETGLQPGARPDVSLGDESGEAAGALSAMSLAARCAASTPIRSWRRVTRSAAMNYAGVNFAAAGRCCLQLRPPAPLNTRSTWWRSPARSRVADHAGGRTT